MEDILHFQRRVRKLRAVLSVVLSVFFFLILFVYYMVFAIFLSSSPLSASFGLTVASALLTLSLLPAIHAEWRRETTGPSVQLTASPFSPSSEGDPPGELQRGPPGALRPQPRLRSRATLREPGLPAEGGAAAPRSATTRSHSFRGKKSRQGKTSWLASNEKVLECESLSSSISLSSSTVSEATEINVTTPSALMSPSTPLKFSPVLRQKSSLRERVNEEFSNGVCEESRENDNLVRDEFRVSSDTVVDTNIAFLTLPHVFEKGVYFYIIAVLWLLLLLIMLCGSLFIACDTNMVGAATPALAVPLLLMRLQRVIPQSMSYTSVALNTTLAPVVAIVTIILYGVIVVLTALKNVEEHASVSHTENGLTSLEMYVMSRLSSIVVLAAGLMPLEAAFHYIPTHIIISDRQSDGGKVNPLLQDKFKGCEDLSTQKEEDLSSIALTAHPSTLCLSTSDLCRRPNTKLSFYVAPTNAIDPNKSSRQLFDSGLRISTDPVERNLTILFLTYRDTRCTQNRDVFADHSLIDEMGASVAPRFSALADAVSALTKSHGSFFLTAYKDIVGLVWGALPMSVDPLLQAVSAGNHILSTFTPPAGTGNDYCALVGAILHSPHAVVRTIGVGGLQMVHFLSAEYSSGEQLLQRGMTLRGIERRQTGKSFKTSGLLLDRSAAHLGASHFLSRPVGIVPLLSFETLKDESQNALRMYAVIYDYVSSLEDHSNLEWHLAAQERERRSAAFRPAAEAAQAFHQGDLQTAEAVVEAALQGKDDHFLQLLLTDINRIGEGASGGGV